MVVVVVLAPVVVVVLGRCGPGVVEVSSWRPGVVLVDVLVVVVVLVLIPTIITSNNHICNLSKGINEIVIIAIQYYCNYTHLLEDTIADRGAHSIYIEEFIRR